MGREAHLPARDDQGGGRARLRVDLRLGGKWRHQSRPAGIGADHGGDGLWLCVHLGLHLDPQHGVLDDRPFRQPGGEGQIPSAPRHDGRDRQLLPDRARLGIRRRGAQDEGGQDGDDYIVTGSKQFISGGGENEIYVTMVRTGEEGPKGISCLVIEKGMAGVSFGANERKLGWHSQPTAQVMFDGVRVPKENLVGAEGEGFRIAMMGLDGGRLNIGACSLGGAQRCLDEAIKYTKDRKQFGTAIADFQNTQFMLADMATELEAARALLYMAAAKVTANAPDKTKFAAMAKRLATDTGSSVADRALQLHGGYGYLMDYPIERFWRDLRVHSILEGTNQVMRMIVGRDLTRQ
ncbi:Branched-chain acyl-CoA dehydrogenase [hydrothermal vent metagenome]|uniref:Branched-chain acyl-CoA dehydrogenase n=1 Tax=hydrothermal vent metagenome TaxID=652676 RepID=A0A160TJ29_9ZZZZ